MTLESRQNMSLEEMDQHSLIHPFTNLKDYSSGKLGGPRIVTGGSGIRIQDQHGNQLIDAFAGLYCVNIGYGRTEVAEAIAEQAHKLAYYHAYAMNSNEPAIRLSHRLVNMAPGGMARVYFGLSGSDANETQVKLVWFYNNVLGRAEKKKIISRHRGYHGGSVMSGSLTGLPVYHTAFDLPVKGVLHTSTPHHYWHATEGEDERAFSKRCAAELEEMILAEGPDTVAAFIGEPVLGTGGIIPPPEGYWDEIQAVLQKYDILLIADEVVCGFGRIGTPFGCDRYGIKPDLITVAKGLTSAYQPLSGAIVGEKVWKVLEQASDSIGPFSHGYTYSAHPVGAAAALANLDVIERDDLTGNAERVGGYLNQRLAETFGDHPIVGEVRGVGMLAAVEFVADPARKTRFDPSMKVGARLSAAVLAEGVIARAMPHGDILGFAPPLVMTREEVDEIVEKVGRGVAKVTDELVNEGAIKV